jgi:hypothetical protein
MISEPITEFSKSYTKVRRIWFFNQIRTPLFFPAGQDPAGRNLKEILRKIVRPLQRRKFFRPCKGRVDFSGSSVLEGR